MQMIMTVVSCGESARNWIPIGTTIGSNDVLKWGLDTDYLVLANNPGKFKNGRLDTIKKTKAKVLVYSYQQWKEIFPKAEKIMRVTSFNKMIQRDYIYTSATTPIMCLSLAIKLGATEIVMWGVDMLNHKTYSVGTKKGDREAEIYRKFFKAAEKKGVKIYLGALNTAFDNDLPLWEVV